MSQVVPARRVFFCIVKGVASAAAAGSVAALALPASAGTAPSSGCAAVNRGSLNFAAAGGGTAAGSVTMEAGETLTLTLTSKGEARISVLGGGGAGPLQSSRATTMLFVAPESDTFAVRLDADGQDGAMLRTRCASVAEAAAERALLDRRKAFLASRDPDRIRIDRPAGGLKAVDSLSPPTGDGSPPRDVKASISLSELASAMKIGTPHKPSILDFWFEGRYTSYDALDVNARQSDGSFSEMYFGSKYMLGPDIMLGYLAQFDQAGEDTLDGSDVKAGGWMAGPYMSVRMGHGIFFDARAARGVTETLPSGIAVSTQPQDRSLVRGTLRGERQVAGWTVAPSVALSYVEDAPAMRGAMDEAAAAPAGTGRLDMLPEVKRRFDLDSATYVEPRFAAGGFLAFDTLSTLSPAGMAGQVPDLHWKAEAGVAVGVKDSMNLQATGGVESGGEAAADTWSGRLQLNMPLGK